MGAQNSVPKIDKSTNIPDKSTDVSKVDIPVSTNTVSKIIPKTDYISSGFQPTGTDTPSFSNITSLYIDMATYDVREHYMYSNEPKRYIEGPWESHMTEAMRRIDSYSVRILNNPADLLSYVFYDIKIPEIKCKHSDKKIFWSKNLAHNICEFIHLYANDLRIISMSSYDLDCHMNYNISKEKYDSYNYHIGNRDELTKPRDILNATTLSLPIPFYFSKNRKYLPVSACYNNILTIRTLKRDWNQLVTMIDSKGNKSIPTLDDIVVSGEINLCVYGNYIMCNKELSKGIKESSRVFVTESYYNPPIGGIGSRSWNDNKEIHNTYDLRVSGSVKTIFCSIRDVSSPNEWSIYLPSIKNISLSYEETSRIYQQPAHHFNYIYPYFHTNGVQEQSGIYMYTYCTSNVDEQSSGSTNYSKLTNVSWTITSDKNSAGHHLYMSFLTKCAIYIKDGSISMLTPSE
jgi:hypothetical protein